MSSIGLPDNIVHQSSTSSEPVVYMSTLSKDDAWTWILNKENSSFSAINETSGFHYAGDFSRRPDGFLKMTINSTTDPGLTTSGLEYAYEIADTALIIRPTNLDKDLIIAAKVK
jgi:hypothetical protein